MLHRETVSSDLLELLSALQVDPTFKDLRLVGGTSLALQIGHRESIDIDLFGRCSLAQFELTQLLQGFGETQYVGGSTNIHIFRVRGIKLDIVNYPYPWLEDVLEEGGFRLAHRKDIAAMKIAAITQRGSRKDFLDLFFLLKEYTLSQILSFYEQKIQDGNSWLALRSLTYFEDAELQPMPKLLQTVEWKDVKETIVSEVRKMI